MSNEKPYKYNRPAFAYAAIQIEQSQEFRELNPEEQLAVIECLDKFITYYNDALLVQTMRNSTTEENV